MSVPFGCVLQAVYLIILNLSMAFAIVAINQVADVDSVFAVSFVVFLHGLETFPRSNKEGLKKGR